MTMPKLTMLDYVILTSTTTERLELEVKKFFRDQRSRDWQLLGAPFTSMSFSDNLSLFHQTVVIYYDPNLL